MGRWFDPLLAPKSRQARRVPMPDTSRRIVLDGVAYPSLTEAAKAKGCSITRIYKLIGEGHRFHVKRTP